MCLNSFKQNTAKIKVNNIDINYLKVGNGPRVLFFLPGALGIVHTNRRTIIALPLSDQLQCK